MTRPDDALEILLPDADDVSVSRARDVTRFLRLLSSDAQPAYASTVGVDLERARSELEAADRADIEGALCDLLHHYLLAACAADSFAHFGEAGLDVRAAWRLLAEFELEFDWIAGQPLPGETTLAVCTRLIASLERLAVSPEKTALWRARLAHALDGPRSGERAYRELLRAALSSAQSNPLVGAPGLSLQRALVAGIAECLLERGAVRDARALLFEHLARHGTDTRARQLLSWARLALGDAAAARALIVGLRPWLGALPAGLLALREARPEWLPCLAGRSVVERVLPREYTVRDRSDVGAAVLAVFAFSPRAGAGVLHLDVAPALRDRVRTWLLEVADAHECAGSPERRVIAEARTVIDHAPQAFDSAAPSLERSSGFLDPSTASFERASRGSDSTPTLFDDPASSGQLDDADGLIARATDGSDSSRSALSPPPSKLRSKPGTLNRPGGVAKSGGSSSRLPAGASRTLSPVDAGRAEGGLRFSVGGAAARARALVPILDDEAEVAGWLYVECEHHLLPGPARLAALARGWRTAVLLARERGPDADSNDAAAGGTSASADLSRARELESSPLSRVFHDLVGAIGIKLYQRLWSGFSLENGTACLVASGGEGVGFDGDHAAGRGRALARAISTGGTIAFEEPDERLSLHARAASGFVVSLTVADRAVGFLVVESSRRRDFKAKDVELCARLAADHGLALRMAQFAVWHRARFHFEPWFDPARADFRSFASHAIAAARSRSGVVLAGPSGAGKLVLARWIHFESDRASRPFKIHGAALDADPHTSLAELVATAAGGTLVLDDVEELAPARQEELLRYLEKVERATDRDGHSETGVRIVATTKLGLAAARDAGRMRSDLAARLDRVTLLVPSLCERREEIPELFAAMARRFADEENAATPRLTDEALALLWRQPWRENLRGLENVAYKLVLLYGGEAVTPEHLAKLARHFGLELVKKLPSRHPDPRDLVAALRTTRTTGGRINKTRAAFYLGWDPDTLVARMQSEGIREEALEEEAAWQIHREEERGRDGDGGEE